MHINWQKYPVDSFYDELIRSSGYARKHARKAASYFRSFNESEINELVASAEATIKTLGISFTVYSDAGNIDRNWPYDIIPRIIPISEWSIVAKGLTQRLKALNLFIHDIYNNQDIIKENVFPGALIENSANFRKICIGMKPAYGVWAHVCGTDLVRDSDGKFYVLEDNLRVPSGVSYMLENRKLSKQVLPELFDSYKIKPLREYPAKLFDTLSALSPRAQENPEIVILTPGVYNSAYFEHSFLAQQMGVELVEGADLIVEKDIVYMKTIKGLERVDVIYRRIDDLYLDPKTFNKDSIIGVPGLMNAWLKGNVAIANAPGAGVADDKVVYTYVPKMIEYYLGEKPILDNVPSFLCSDKEQCDYVLANLDSLVVKPANESGGYGMLVGPQATKKEKKEFVRRIKNDARNYMAQPLVSLSTSPVVTSRGAEPRHIDLRPFVLQSDKDYTTPGGLTRVALRKGSYVVNSSQGGGSKDTWIVS